MHHLSAHPAKIKHSVVANMYRTATKSSSNSEERKRSLASAQEIAASNGYTAKESEPQNHYARHSTTPPVELEKIPFCVPFISDGISKAIRKCVQRAELHELVRVVDIPPANLKRRLVRNRSYDRLCETPGCVVCPLGREGDCMTSRVVYLITCMWGHVRR